MSIQGCTLHPIKWQPVSPGGLSFHTSPVPQNVVNNLLYESVSQKIDASALPYPIVLFNLRNRPIRKEDSPLTDKEIGSKE